MFAWRSWQTVIPFAFAITSCFSRWRSIGAIQTKRRSVSLLSAASSSNGVLGSSILGIIIIIWCRSWIRDEVSLSVMAVRLQQAWMTAEDSDVAMGIVVFSRALGSVVDIALGSSSRTNMFNRYPMLAMLLRFES